MANYHHTQASLVDLLDAFDATINKLQHLEFAIKGAAALLPENTETAQCRSVLFLLSEHSSLMWSHLDSDLSTFRHCADAGPDHDK